MFNRANLAMFLLPLFGIVITPGPAPAMRIIAMSVELDGKLILSATTGDNGHVAPYTVWRYLKTRPVEPVTGFTIRPASGRPLEAVLQGKLRVKVRYGAEVAASELKLTRRREGDQEWYLDPTWVEKNGPPGDPAEEARKVAAAEEAARKENEEWKRLEAEQQAKEERERDARLQKTQSEARAYQRNTFLIVGSALISVVASLVSLISFAFPRRRLLDGGCLMAVGSGLTALAVSLMETPSLTDDARFSELRSYAVYAAIVGCGLAVFVWVIGNRRRGRTAANNQ
jgi:hypothetical protein